MQAMMQTPAKTESSDVSKTTLQDKMQAIGCVGVCTPGYPLQVPLKTTSRPQQAHLQLAYSCLTTACMFAKHSFCVSSANTTLAPMHPTTVDIMIVSTMDSARDCPNSRSLSTDLPVTESNHHCASVVCIILCVKPASVTNTHKWPSIKDKLSLAGTHQYAMCVMVCSLPEPFSSPPPMKLPATWLMT